MTDRRRSHFLARMLGVVLLCAVLAVPAFADGQEIAEVVVTANRLPVPNEAFAAATETILLDDALRAFQGLDFAEALVTVPGLYVQGHYNAAQDLRLDLRGFGARGNFGIRGIRIYVDGMPESLPDGQVQVDALDPAYIRSVQVLRGPAAALYGNAAGGVILIETVPVRAAPPWRLSYSLGAHGFSSFGASVRTAVPASGAVARLSVAGQSLDGYRQHAASENLRLSADLNVRLSERDVLDIRARATDAPKAQDPGGLSFTDLQQQPRSAALNNLAFNAGEQLDQQSLAWRWQRTLDAQDSLQLSNYFVWRDFENALPFRDGGAVELGRRVAGASALYRWQPGPAMRWSAGLDLDQQHDRRRRFDNDAGNRGTLRVDQLETVTAFGAFVASDLSLSQRLALQGALRYDTLRFSLSDRFLADGDESGARSFGKVSPALGLLLGARADLDLYARYSTAFETPTTTEFADPDGAGFNPALRPQSSRALEIGVRHWPAGSSRLPRFELTAYQIDLKDELVGYELAAQPGRSFFSNAARSRRRGVELSTKFRSGQPLAFSFSGAWTDAVFKRFEQDGSDFSGRHIPGTPGLRLAGGLEWRLEESWALGVDAARVWRIFADNANAVRSPDFLDVGLRVAYGFDLAAGRLEWFAGVRNLLDQRFADNLRSNAFGGRYFEPSPPRYIYAGLRLSGHD